MREGVWFLAIKLQNETSEEIKSHGIDCPAFWKQNWWVVRSWISFHTRNECLQTCDERNERLSWSFCDTRKGQRQQWWWKWLRALRKNEGSHLKAERIFSLEHRPIPTACTRSWYRVFNKTSEKSSRSWNRWQRLHGDADDFSSLLYLLISGR